MGLVEFFMSSPWIYWGVGPSLGAMVGFVPTALFCEWIVRQRWARPMLLVYSETGDRAKDVEETQGKISLRRQVRSSLWHVCGPLNLIGGLLLSLLLSWWAPHSTSLPSVGAFLAQFVLLALIADLGLYWGHRIQHENEWLWRNCHSVHHRLKTPTAFSAAYIEDRDAALQSLLPLLLSALLVRPHPITYTLYVCFHLSNNAWTHSGLDSWWINVISLKCLPLRCSNTLHDAHHRFFRTPHGERITGKCFGCGIGSLER